MYLVENPVLQRELLVNLRTPRAFLLLGLYQLLLAGVVLVGVAQRRAFGPDNQSAVGNQVGQPLLPRTIRDRVADGAEFCGWRDHG